MQAPVEEITPLLFALIHKEMAPYSVCFDLVRKRFFPAYFKSQGMNFPPATGYSHPSFEWIISLFKNACFDSTFANLQHTIVVPFEGHTLVAHSKDLQDIPRCPIRMTYLVAHSKDLQNIPGCPIRRTYLGNPFKGNTFGSFEGCTKRAHPKGIYCCLKRGYGRRLDL